MGLSNELSCETGSFFHCHNPHRFFQSEVLMLHFPTMEPWVAQSVSLHSCSSQLIHTQMWDHPLCQPPPCLIHQLVPCHESSPPQLPISAPPNGLDISSLTPWLLDFHTVRFSGISGCILLLKSLSFFWLCEERQCTYLCLHLGQMYLYSFDRAPSTD